MALITCRLCVSHAVIGRAARPVFCENLLRAFSATFLQFVLYFVGCRVGRHRHIHQKCRPQRYRENAFHLPGPERNPLSTDWSMDTYGSCTKVGLKGSCK